MSNIPILAITCGEPAGIGPEIAVKAAWQQRHHVRSVLLGDASLLEQIAHTSGLSAGVLRLSATFERNDLADIARDHLVIIDCPTRAPIIPGRPDARNGQAVLDTLDIAIAGALQQQFDAIVTAPLQKSTINDAGIAFRGHTEYLALRTATPHVVMMLANSTRNTTVPLRVALATTHLALKDVATAISKDGLNRTLIILDTELRQRFGIQQPRILVAGLNPHAGEQGYLGREEIDMIVPAVQAAQQRGLAIQGPYPADTLFQPHYLEQADCILAMYHDQGLPVFKFASFGHGVNITLGLPFIRTSVDHGTALDVAERGLGYADYSSMVEAIGMAAQMVTDKKQSR